MSLTSYKLRTKDATSSKPAQETSQLFKHDTANSLSCIQAVTKAMHAQQVSQAGIAVNDYDAIAMFTLLGNTLTQQTPLLTNQLSAFDGDLASLRSDMNTLAGNVQSVQDATDLLASITRDMKKTQIKAKLMQTLNGGSKPVLDNAELNLLRTSTALLRKSAAGQRTLTTADSAINLL